MVHKALRFLQQNKHLYHPAYLKKEHQTPCDTSYFLWEEPTCERNTRRLVASYICYKELTRKKNTSLTLKEKGTYLKEEHQAVGGVLYLLQELRHRLGGADVEVVAQLDDFRRHVRHLAQLGGHVVEGTADSGGGGR